MHSDISNIFLDFLNRESREIFGLFNSQSREKHIDFLAKTINIAVFICREFCVATPGSIVECDLVRIAMNRKSGYFREQLIKMPLREDTLGDLWEKKELEYRLFKDQYDALYSKTGKHFIEKYSNAVIHRKSNISKELVENWIEGPDTNPIWKNIIDVIASKHLNRILEIPKRLKEEGLAIKGSTIISHIGKGVGCNPSYFRHVLQNQYFKIYLDEYDLELLYEIPYFKDRYGFNTSNLYYNYQALRAVLLNVSLWDIILNMSAESLSILKRMPGYYEFREYYFKIAENCKNLDEISKIFSYSSRKITSILKSTRIIEDYNKKRIIPPKGFELSIEELEAIAYRLENLVHTAAELYEDIKFGHIGLDTPYSGTVVSKGEKMIHGANISEEQFRNNQLVVIFVALQMERESLIERWSLKNPYPSMFWTGLSGNTIVMVYGPDHIGRVPAAISTMRMFYDLKDKYNRHPDLLIVAGIAGGFEEEMMCGHLIIAESVADLAMRKITDEEEKIRPEFRPKEFTASDKISHYVKSGNFDISLWEQDVIKGAEWPAGLRPAIKYGTIASVDEVVSSEEYKKKLRAAWPKLLGIEMESGGVCAAADKFDLSVNIIRVVSDLADPMKSDNEWRKRAMKTIGFLLERIDYEILISR